VLKYIAFSLRSGGTHTTMNHLNFEGMPEAFDDAVDEAESTKLWRSQMAIPLQNEGEEIDFITQLLWIL